MKSSQMLVFIIVVLSIYTVANYYVGLRGFQSLPSFGWVKPAYIFLFTTLAFSYVFSRFLEKTSLYTLHHITYWVGAFWMAALMYFFLAVVFIDLLRLANMSLHFLPANGTSYYQNLKITTFVVTVLLTASLLGYGYWNARSQQLKKLNISIAKNAGKRKKLNIVMVSDIHLGSLFGKKEVETMVTSINKLNPDIVLLAGDILDEAQMPIFRNNTGEPLKNLKAPLGVYGVTGNHEYIGGVNTAIQYLESLNVKLLRDTSWLIDSSFYLAGRDDRDGMRFSRKGRKTLPDVLRNVDHQLPVILLDHQPFHLDQAQNNGVDLQLSGHTHNGQFWPMNLITQKMYEIDWGYLKKGNTHVYVSCGYGTWGPPIRIGNKPEMVQIEVLFKN